MASENFMKTALPRWLLVVGLFWVAGCKHPQPTSLPELPKPPTPKVEALKILAGSENKAMEPILLEFTKTSGLPVEMVYKGSVDIMIELQQGAIDFHAVWPTNSLWLNLSGNQNIRDSQSITRSPIVFGIKRSRAAKLGLSIGQGLPTRQLLEFARTRQLTFLITNPTQSNSGGLAYLAFLHALNGKEDALTHADLERPELTEAIQTLMTGVNRTSPSSGWLKDLYVESPDLFDSMVNYESTILETNMALERKNQEPLLVFYPTDGQAIADSPLAYVAHPETDREKDFLKLQAYLLSAPVQNQLSLLGWRTGMVGADPNPSVFRSDWGLDTKRVLQPFPLPSAEVIRHALNLYQTTLKKPSLTVFVLDYSGSMQGPGEHQLKSAMNLLFQEEQAVPYLLQTGNRDETIVIPFDGAPRDIKRTHGNNAADLEGLRTYIQQSIPTGGTDFYTALIKALEEIKAVQNREDFQTSIILMTDGMSEGRFEAFQKVWEELPVPVFTIMFGEADPSQLERISTMTRARLLDGRKNLIAAFREAKGYN